MNILHLAKYYWPDYGGIETATQQIAEAGVALGHHVQCRVSQVKPGKDISERINQVEVLRLSTPAHLFNAPLSQYSFDPTPYDILHVHLAHPLAEFAVLNALSSFPKSLRFFPYFHAFPVRHPRLGKLWFGRITSKLFDRADAILMSNPTLPEAFPQLRRWESKFKVLPFACAALDSAKLKALGDQRATPRIVLALGRLVKYKGYDYLLHAWASVVANGPARQTLKLVIAGEGPEHGKLLRLVSRLGLENSVELTGTIPDTRKHELFQQASLFVAPSTTTAETFGISILEAMGMGLPVVTTSLPTGVSLLSRNGACGGVVPPRDATALAGAIQTLLTDTSKRERAALANHGFVSEHYSFASVVRSYEELLR